MASFDATPIRRFLAASFLVLGLSTIWAQQLSSADPSDQATAKLVSRIVPQLHLSRSPIDDKISSMFLDRLLKDLDPQKSYFLQSDIQEFEANRTTLDDDLRAGRLDIPYKIVSRYKQRVKEQTAVAQGWVDVTPDFTINEAIETDFKKLNWCASKEELNDRWRRRIKFDLLSLKLDGQTEEESRDRLHKRYRNNSLNVEQWSKGEELEIILTSLTNCFDPHSTYMSPISSEDFAIQMRLSLDGIGALLGAEDGYTVVKQIIPGGAAAEDGRLKVGDRIVGVGQAEGEIVDIFETKLTDVVRLIRGPRDTVVRLQVRSKDGAETKTLAMTRKKVELKDSAVKGEIIDTSSRLGRPGRIGVLSVPSFYHDFEGARRGGEFKNVTADVARVLEDFQRENVDAVIVDLRNNGGGALEDAVKTSGHFIDRGPVVQVKEPQGDIQLLDDEDPGVKCDKPLIVLCNRLSASASEIFAGVIKDYRRGIILGDTTTHGKGTVQNLIELSQRHGFRSLLEPKPQAEGTLKLTISQFYRVNGDSTQNRGVRSDIVLPSLMDHWELGEEFLENAIPFDQIPAARYSENRLVSPEIVALLQQKSQDRVRQNPDFQKVDRAIARYIDKKERTALPLSEEQVRAERAADEELKKQVDTTEVDDGESAKTDGPIFPVRFYEDEVLNVALDYLDALRGKVAKSAPQTQPRP